MGGAMARQWVGTHRTLVYDRDAALPSGTERIETLNLSAIPADVDMTNLVLVLAIKPQSLPSIASLLAPFGARGALALSIMAGVRMSTLRGLFSGSVRVVRAMPNTPAAIGRGITAAIAHEGVNHVDRELVESLLAKTGEVVWVDKESDLDVVTAVSGSGPAYFFRFTEALAKAGAAAGLSPELAMKLARATFIGGAALADIDLSQIAALRAQVTSSGGTTAAGLARMDEDDAIDQLVSRVVSAAASRSRELAG
jgi:pyrroline-5-carboxylate reductase